LGAAPGAATAKSIQRIQQIGNLSRWGKEFLNRSGYFTWLRQFGAGSAAAPRQHRHGKHDRAQWRVGGRLAEVSSVGVASSISPAGGAASGH
jgi:hypothetical protein